MACPSILWEILPGLPFPGNDVSDQALWFQSPEQYFCLLRTYSVTGSFYACSGEQIPMMVPSAHSLWSETKRCQGWLGGVITVMTGSMSFPDCSQDLTVNCFVSTLYGPHSLNQAARWDLASFQNWDHWQPIFYVSPGHLTKIIMQTRQAVYWDIPFNLIFFQTVPMTLIGKWPFKDGPHVQKVVEQNFYHSSRKICQWVLTFEYHRQE